MKLSFDHLPLPHLRHFHGIYQEQKSDIRLVGGCVRDTILNRPVLDIDLATPLPPQEGMDLLQSHGIHVIPTGLQHGTITAVLDHRPYEITTLRHDVQTYGRHADVAFTATWQEDAMRRDFTINGLYAHIDSGIVEDYHHGLDDLKTGTIRFIGDAHARMAEDYLRIFRFFRFYAWYGQRPPSNDLLKTIQNHLPGLEGIARERIRTEFLKLIKGPKARSSIEYMTDIGAMTYVSSLPFQRNIPLEEPLLIAESLLFAIFIQRYQDVAQLSKELRLSNHQRQHLQDLLHFNETYPKESLNYLTYKLSPAIVSQALLLQGKPHQANEVLTLQIPPFPIKGTDAPIPPGPTLGNVLKECQRWWAEHDFRPTHGECLTWIKNYLETSKR